MYQAKVDTLIHIPGVLFQRHLNLYSIDYFLIYEINTTMLAQLYARGLVTRFHTFDAALQVTEYTPGVVHISVESYRLYQEQVWSYLWDPRAINERNRLKTLLSSSIHHLARANYRFESQQHFSPGITTLIDAAIAAMSFYNFNDETALPEHIIAAVADHTSLVAYVRDALTPVVTPYMSLLAQRIQRAEYQPTTERRLHNVTFLLEFDPLSEPIIPDHWEASTSYKPYTVIDRKQRRKTALATIQSTLLQTLDTQQAYHLYDVLELACAAADHEESRHYWQARTIRNFRTLCALHGADIASITVDDLIQLA